MFTNMFFIWEEAKGFNFAPTNTFQWQMVNVFLKCLVMLHTDWPHSGVKEPGFNSGSATYEHVLRKCLCFILLFVTRVHDNYNIKIIYLILEYFLDIFYLILGYFLAPSCFWLIRFLEDSMV